MDIAEPMHGTLTELSECMYKEWGIYVREHRREPHLLVTFSNDGYRKASASRDAVAHFSHPLSQHKYVNGFPYKIICDQKEDFIVHVM